MRRKRQNIWEDEWDDLRRREEKYIYKNCVQGTKLFSKLQKIVPKNLQSKLDAAFIKAFRSSTAGTPDFMGKKEDEENECEEA